MNIKQIVLALRGHSIEEIQSATSTFVIKYANVRESQLNYILVLYDAMILTSLLYRADKSDLNLEAYKEAKRRYDKEIDKQENK